MKEEKTEFRFNSMLVLVRWSPPDSKGLMQRRKLCTEDAKESKCHGKDGQF